jgi:hypothetical protein
MLANGGEGRMNRFDKKAPLSRGRVVFSSCNFNLKAISEKMVETAGQSKW